MKKVLFLFLLCISITAAAQNNEGKRPVYCEIMGYNFWGFGKVKVQLDMGDYAYHSSRSYDSIYEENGKKKKFNTMMEVLDYMGARGWKLIGTYYVTIYKSNVVHYVMEKWISDESERKEGLILKEDTDSPIKEVVDDTYYIPKKEEKK